MKIEHLFYTNEKGELENFLLDGEKEFFQKCKKKSKRQQEKIWNLVSSFMYLVSVHPMDRTLVPNPDSTIFFTFFLKPAIGSTYLYCSLPNYAIISHFLSNRLQILYGSSYG